MPLVIFDEHQISRHVFHPHMTKDEESHIYRNMFEFPGGLPESVIWREVINDNANVHQMGRDSESSKRSKNSHVRYIGFGSSFARLIRAIKNEVPDGHGFDVVHEPSEGEHHAHVMFQFAEEQSYDQLPKAKRQNLKYLLSKLFSNLELAPEVT
jgi:hypothetical protein